MTEHEIEMLPLLLMFFFFLGMFIALIRHNDDINKIENDIRNLYEELWRLKMADTAMKEQLAIAQARLTLYYKAEKAILSGQSYEVEGLKLTRANLKDVQNMIAALENKISALKAKMRGRSKFRIVRPGW